MKRILIIIPSAVIFLWVLAALPLPIPPSLDFQVIYHADLGLLRGISLYDHAGQVNMIAALANVPPQQVFVLPFPYPPWYALAALPLAMLPIQTAAQLWFGLNLLMFFASVWLLTAGWQPVRRLIAFPVALFFLPVLGSLLVGQYGFPVLLGAALFIAGLKDQKIAPGVLGAVLLTFKPHLGLVILLIGLVQLALRRDAFGRRAWLVTALAGAFLFGIGFLASPAWPLDYFHSLTGFKDVSQCQLCNNASMQLAELMGGGFTQAIWIALVLVILLAVWLVWRWRVLRQQPALLIAASVLVVLIASPYLQNYDYILLLVPFFVLAERMQGFNWITLLGAYLLPLLGLGIWGVAGDISLVISLLILFVLLNLSLNKLVIDRQLA